MEVQLLRMTDRPAEAISSAAATSYGKDNYSFKRIETCYNNGHMSVFEHVNLSFRIEGISRSCSQQLVRHRLASFTEKSLRYSEPSEGQWFVKPQSIIDNPYSKAYDAFMESAETLYYELLDHGIKKEDARFVLPLATKTDITVTMNLREFLHFLDLRLPKNAQWEIRQLADKMMNMVKVRLYNTGNKDLANLIFSKYMEE